MTLVSKNSILLWKYGFISHKKLILFQTLHVLCNFSDSVCPFDKPTETISFEDVWALIQNPFGDNYGNYNQYLFVAVCTRQYMHIVI